MLYRAIWRELEGELDRRRMRFPKELILLGGAPGAGKGTNSDFIRNVRDIEAPPIVVSQTPERSGPQTNCIPARAAAEFRFRDALGSVGGRGQRIAYLRAAGAGDAN